jgi:hypothetical protein
MLYINFKHNKEVETIDSAETYKEALYLLTEYQMSDPYNEYWISKKNHNEKSKTIS